MALEKSIKKNYIYNMLYQMLAIVSPLITAPYVSRIFGADGVGIQSFTNSVMTYFTMFAALGTATYGQREVARRRDQKKEVSKVFWEIECVSVISTSVALAAWLLLILVSDFYRPYYIMWTLSVAAVMLDISWLFAGFEEFKKIVIRNSAVKIAGIVLLFTAVKTKNDIALYIGILSASSFLGNLSMWTYLKKYVDPPKFKEMDLKVHFKETMVFFVPTIATSVYTVLDKVMIGFLVEGNYENGYYEQATKIIQIAKTIIFSLNTVMGSRMAYLFGQKKDQEIRSKLHGCMDFILFIGMAMSFGIAGIAPIFVTWYFGTGFETVVQVLMVLSPIIVIIGISNCLGVLYFTPAGRNRETNRIICLGALVNLCLNLILIPKFASSGAAIASVFAELVITMLFVKKGQDYMSLGQLFSYTWKRVLAGFLMYAGIRFLPKILGWQTLWMTIFQVGMGAVIYVGILLILRDQMLIKSLKKLLHR